MARKFGKRPGTTIIERDQSTTAAALGATKAAMVIYSAQGPSDKEYDTASTGDFIRLFGKPHASMTLRSGVVDYGRSMQNALRFIEAGIPLVVKRIKPATGTAGSATIISDAAGTPKSVVATAKGHGTYYNDIRLVIRGLDTVTRKIPKENAAVIDLGDYVLPRSLKIAKVDALDSPLNDEDFDTGDTEKVFTFGAVTVTVTYRNALYGNRTTLAVAGGPAAADFTFTYQRTTETGTVKLLVCHKDELVKKFPNGTYAGDPDSNNLEAFTVSYREDGIDVSGNSTFIEDVINENSEIISVAIQAGFDEGTLPVATKVSTEATDAIALTLATDGDYAAADADAVLALNTFLNVNIDFLYIFDAGFNDTVKKKMALVCQARLFPTCYIDPPESYFIENGNKVITTLKGTEARVADNLINWRMSLGMGEEGEWAHLAGSTWGRITDVYNNGRKLWMPPTYEVGFNAITVDEGAGPWKAVAGPRRGITRFEKLAINLYEYRDILVAKQVNPLIIDERGVQMYYGNNTLKMVTSAMQNSHARKTRGRMSREYYFLCLDYNFEDIDVPTINDLQYEFERINNNYGAALDQSKVVVGPPKTTAADIANKTLKIGVGLIFKDIAEEIEITTTVFKAGTDLSVQIV